MKELWFCKHRNLAWVRHCLGFRAYRVWWIEVNANVFLLRKDALSANHLRMLDGLLDLNIQNKIEYVEHSVRLAKAYTNRKKMKEEDSQWP